MITQSRKVLFRIPITLALLVAILLLALWIKPPDILRVGANYSAKIICSNVFLAGRDPEVVLHSDVQAPGIALLRLMRVSVDREHRVVRTGLFGFIGDGLAVAGRASGSAAAATAAAPTLPGASVGAAELWPDDNKVATNNALDRILADDTLAGPGMRAIVVVQHGRIVAERYGAGFSAATPLLGWSMTKSVLAGVVGILVKGGRLARCRRRPR